MCKKLFLGLVLFVMGVASTWTDNYKPFVLSNTQIVPIHSKFTNRDHELVVVLPSSYSSNPDKKYPVLYYLDAYWDTPLLVSTYGNLVYDNVVPEFIMVGLSYPSKASYDKERRIDYTPTAVDDSSGKANLFLDFIQKEVAPLIETKFRGDKKGRVLSGTLWVGFLLLQRRIRHQISFQDLLR